VAGSSTELAIKDRLFLRGALGLRLRQRLTESGPSRLRSRAQGNEQCNCPPVALHRNRSGQLFNRGSGKFLEFSHGNRMCHVMYVNL
jgi:hypothetical protein